MLRAAAIAVAILAVPALAHADPPGMTAPVGSAPSPGSSAAAPRTYAPTPAPATPSTYSPTSPTSPPATRAAPATYVPASAPTTYVPAGTPTTYAPAGPTTYAPAGAPTTYAPAGPTTYAPAGATTYAPGGAPTTYAPAGAPTTYAPAGAPTTYAPAPYGQPSQFAAPPTSYNPSYYPAPPSGQIYEQPLPPAPAGTPTYRGWTIGADLAAVTLFGLAVNKEDEDLLALSVGTYALGAPLVHAVKGRTGHAFASLGMRVGFPLLGAMLGEGLHAEPKCGGYYQACYDEGPSDEAVIGALLGIGVAMVVDSAYLARGDQPKTPPQPQWGPTVRASQGGFALGAAGTF